MPHDETPHDKLPAELPLREHVERAVTDYLEHLDGHHSAPLQDRKSTRLNSSHRT